MPPPPPSPAPPPEPPTSGVLHTTEQTRTYPCPACGGELRFDVSTQKLRCADCGNVRELTADTTAVVDERDLRSALQALQSRGADAITSFAGASKEIVCQNCGGHTTFDGSLTADRCPYCATPIQRSDVHDAPDRIPVDGVVPFQVDEKAARRVDRGVDQQPVVRAVGVQDLQPHGLVLERLHGVLHLRRGDGHGLHRPAR